MFLLYFSQIDPFADAVEDVVIPIKDIEDFLRLYVKSDIKTAHWELNKALGPNNYVLHVEKTKEEPKSITIDGVVKSRVA